MMSEEFLYYVWTYKLFNTTELKTVQNEALKIIKQGQRNTDSGPDFFNSMIQIDGTTWAGNVEIHVNSSDWYKHKHQSDAAYNNVILHVVYNHDTTVCRANGQPLPTLELKTKIRHEFIDSYSKLINGKSWIPCGNQVKKLDSFVLQNWLDRLVIERLERKSAEIDSILINNKNNWEETFFQLLLKYFGLKVNAEPFYILAKNTPLKIIEKHNNLLSVEALLFGQAGFLNTDCSDEYHLELKKEYHFLKAKFNLAPLDKSIWKFLRLRPSNFPTIRISQLAYLLTNQPRIFAQILDCSSLPQIQQLFLVKASTYWDEHYQFEKKQIEKKVKNTGQLFINNLIINVVVPIIFSYASATKNETLKSKSILLLEQLLPEKNNIISNFNTLGIRIKNSLQSQALIELKTNYCTQKKCLQCSIGNYLIKN
ncbi:MAG: DUF2851 family protein [Flavobacteriales bacterium]|nr:DUF2851 family protein [Flavobacteriales bacterium]